MPITQQCRDAFALAYETRRKERNALWVEDSQGVVHIPLPDGSKALIDSSDRTLISQFTWHTKKTRTAGLVYAVTETRGKEEFLHNILLDIQPGTGKQVDHKDRNGLNCVRSNMRVTTTLKNGWNKTYPIGSSGFRGVTKRGRKWAAQIQIDGVKQQIAVFSSPVEAAIAYNEYAKKHFGEFAVLNEGI